jgi:hypothetical protein
MKYHLWWTQSAQIATCEQLCTLLAEIEACLKSRPLCALSNDPHNPTYLSPGHFLIGEPLNQLPSVDYTMLNATDFPGGNPSNNSCNISGNNGHPTISTSFNSVNAGTGHPLTYNREISYYWRRTTQLHSKGPMLSLLRST